MSRTEDQQQFHTFGFVVKRQLFPAPEIDLISREFDAAMREERERQGPALAERQTIHDWVRGRPETAYLETDSRISGKVDELLGPENSLKDNNDGNLYVGDTGWHPGLGGYFAFPIALSDEGAVFGNADLFADGLLLGPDGVEVDGTAVHEVSWARIKASLQY